MSKLKSAVSKAYHAVMENTSDISSILLKSIKIEPSYIQTSRSALEQWKFQCSRTGKVKKKIIAICAMRNKTWIEWAVFASIYIYRMGYKPVLLYSSSEIKRIYSKRRLIEKAGFDFWSGVLKLDYIEKVDVDTFISNERTATEFCAFAEEYSHTVAAYNLKLEEYEADYFVDEYVREKNKAADMIKTYCIAFSNVFEKYSFDRVICPNGLIEKSISLLGVTQKSKIDTMFVEGWARRRGHMIWAFNRPVMFYDILGWSKVIGEWDAGKEKDAESLLEFQNNTQANNKEWFNDFVSVQRSVINKKIPVELEEFIKRKKFLFMLGTNVIGDSATLRRDTIFKNQKEWLKEVIAFFKDHEELSLVVRAHPDEAVLGQKNRIKLGEYASGLSWGIPNIYVVNGEDNINTFSLLEMADAALAWCSNFGVDAVIRNKPAVLAANANYAELNFCYSASTVEDYFKYILRLAKAELTLKEEDVVKAKIYQRIVFKEMSLEATGKNYNASSYRIGENRMHADQSKFFKILTGELDHFGRNSHFTE